MNTTEESINQFSIGYMINPTLNVNKMLRYQIMIFLKEIFHHSTIKGIKNFMIKKDTCIIAPVMFYGTKTKKIKVYKVLSCVLCSVMRIMFALTIYVFIPKH